MIPFNRDNWCLLHGDSHAKLKELPDESVHVCVTSPPYFLLREYLNQDDPSKALEIGQEQTPEEFIQALVKVFSEVKRVLHPTGTLWINLAGSFIASKGRKTSSEYINTPARLAEALRKEGWLLRSEMIWAKINPLPESTFGWQWERCKVKLDKAKREGKTAWVNCPGCDKCKANDGFVLRKGAWRPTRAHEMIYLFAKSDRYYCDGNAVKQPARDSTVMRDRYTRILYNEDEQYAVQHDHETDSGGQANLKTWQIFQVEGTPLDHYASFPSGIPSLAIQAGTSEKGVCSKCGKPWSRVVERESHGDTRAGLRDKDAFPGKHLWRSTRDTDEPFVGVKTLGWKPSCNCVDSLPTESVVLDPFCGTGTSGVVALSLGRKFVGVELSEEYVEISKQCLESRGSVRKARPTPQTEPIEGFFED